MNIKRFNQGFNSPVRVVKKGNPLFFSVFPEGDGEDKPALTADFIAAQADKNAGPDAKYTFDEVMDIVALGESGNQNIYQTNKNTLEPDIDLAQGEWQMEQDAIRTAYQHVKNFANARGMSYPELSEEDLTDITELPYETRKLLAYALMYVPENNPTKDVLTGRTAVPDFWFKYWNRGKKDRTGEFEGRVAGMLKP